MEVSYIQLEDTCMSLFEAIVYSRSLVRKLVSGRDAGLHSITFRVSRAGIHGEHTESEGGVYDISNKRRLGLTELQAVTEMYNGVKEIIKMEKDLQAGKGAKSSSCSVI